MFLLVLTGSVVVLAGVATVRAVQADPPRDTPRSHPAWWEAAP